MNTMVILLCVYMYVCMCMWVCVCVCVLKELMQTKYPQIPTHKYDIPMSPPAITPGFNGMVAPEWQYRLLAHKVESLNISQSS